MNGSIGIDTNSTGVFAELGYIPAKFFYPSWGVVNCSANLDGGGGVLSFSGEYKTCSEDFWGSWFSSFSCKFSAPPFSFLTPPLKFYFEMPDKMQKLENHWYTIG